MIQALGMSPGGNVKQRGPDRLVRFLQSKGIRPHVPDVGLARVAAPLDLKTPKNGRAHGYEAMALADICDAVLAARRTGTINPQQEHIANRCEVLMRGFFRVGIIALVDEATGYQVDRARDALAEILEQFISADLARWAKRFPDEYYEQLYRLRKIETKEGSRRPMYLGNVTNDIVYRRLAPGVIDELRRINPRKGKRRTAKHHQWLTEEIGQPELQHHLTKVITIMKISTTYKEFLLFLDRALPKFGATYEFRFSEQHDLDLNHGQRTAN